MKVGDMNLELKSLPWIQYLVHSFKTGHHNHTINDITQYVPKLCTPSLQDSGAAAFVYS